MLKSNLLIKSFLMVLGVLLAVASIVVPIILGVILCTNNYVATGLLLIFGVIFGVGWVIAYNLLLYSREPW